MVLQAYIDESYSQHGKSFVLAGCIATAEAWASFAAEWEALLPEYGSRTKSGKHYFHLVDIRKDAPEMELFWRVIERHVPVLVSCQFKPEDLKRAQSRLYYPGAVIEWDKSDVTEYNIGFYCLMNAFHAQRPKMAGAIPLDERVDFYFDKNKEHEDAIKDAWRAYMARVPPDIRERYGHDARFDDDKEFVALQAADFWAGWIRRWYDDGGYELVRQHKFPAFTPKAKRWYIDITYDEDDLAKMLAGYKIEGGPDREPVILPKGGAKF